jgi:UDP-glucose 4-epimerase
MGRVARHRKQAQSILTRGRDGLFGAADTPNGTGIRDFIHVVDPTSGHLSALSHLKQPGVLTVNLGTGAGLLEVVRTFEVVSGRSIPYAIGERRAGDVAICYADPTLAQDALGWKSTR